MIIKNVRIVDHQQDFKGGLRIAEGKIAQIFVDKAPEAKEGEPVLDGKGAVLMPGFIDMHTHLRDPGQTHKESLESGLKAAARGGYVWVCAMANTDPVTDTADKVRQIQRRAENFRLPALTQASALTINFEDRVQALVDVESIRKETKLFSNDGKNVGESQLMQKGLRLSKQLDFILSCHCEPEADMVEKIIEENQSIGGNLHICHISQKETVQYIRRAKEKGTAISCEATPHHLYASNNDYTVNPPIGSEEDRRALIEGIKDGTVDVVATDHAPHTEEDKKNGMPGISNIEYAFSMVHTVLSDNGIGLQTLSRLMSKRPAELLKEDRGEIQVGKEADLVLVRPESSMEVRTDDFISKGKNTPFEGDVLQGEVVTTIVKGAIVYDHGSIA